MRKGLLLSVIGVAAVAAATFAALACTVGSRPAHRYAAAHGTYQEDTEEGQGGQETEQNTAKAERNVSETEQSESEVTENVTDEEITSKSLVQSYDWDEEETYLLGKLAMAEAEDQDTEGKALVILVVLNRVWSDEFPDTIAEVIYQEGQFTPVSSGRFDEAEPDEDCYAALALVSVGWDASQGALYFESRSASTWHSENLTFLFKHGDHYFYR